jgi:hypothetical protein
MAIFSNATGDNMSVTGNIAVSFHDLDRTLSTSARHSTSADLRKTDRVEFRN